MKESKFFNLNAVEQKSSVEYKNYKHLSHLRDIDITIKPIEKSKNKDAIELCTHIAAFPQEVQDRLEDLRQFIKISEEGNIKVCSKHFNDKIQNEKDVCTRLNNAIEKVVYAGQVPMETGGGPEEVIKERAKEAIEGGEKYPWIYALALRKGEGEDYWIEDKGSKTSAGGAGKDTSSSAVTLHFDMQRFDPDIQASIMAARNITNKRKLQKKTIEITSGSERSQDQNRTEVTSRLNTILRKAMDPKGDIDKTEAQLQAEEKERKRKAAKMKRNQKRGDDSRLRNKKWKGQQKRNRQGNRVYV